MDCGSGRPPTGRQQSPAEIRGNRSTKGELSTASYYMLVQPADSLRAFAGLAPARLLCHARLRHPVSTIATSRGGERREQHTTLETRGAIDLRPQTVRSFYQHQERGCPTRPQPEPYQGGNRGPMRITGDAVPRRGKDGGMTRPERVVVF